MKINRLLFSFVILLSVCGGAISAQAQDIVPGSSVFVWKERPAAKSKSNSNFNSGKKTGGQAKAASGKKTASSKQKSSSETANSISNEESLNEQSLDESPVLTGGILNGLTTYLIMPEYADNIRKAHISDEVKVRLIIDGEGNVISAKAESGHPSLRDGAVKAAMKASFYGSRFMGTPVKTTGVLIYVLSPGNEGKYNVSPAKIPPSVDGGILNDKAIAFVTPGYPDSAKASGAKGEVRVRVTIDERGNVVSAKALSGDSALYETAVKAAKEATFPATIVLGNKVKVNGLIVYSFAP